MAPLSEARRKAACELVIIAKCDGINTLDSKELRLVKRYMQEIGEESLEGAYKQALEEKKTLDTQAKATKVQEKNSARPAKQNTKSGKQCPVPSKFLTDWPEGSFEKFAHPLHYKDFVDKCKANPNRVALFKEGLTRHTASDTALRVRNAKYRAFVASKGHFETRILQCDESYSVYVKYVPQKAA